MAGEEGRAARQEWWLAWSARAEATLRHIATPVANRSGGEGQEVPQRPQPQRGNVKREPAIRRG
eukprot:14002716-Alexandrium_andersonii.AAC.1